VDGPDGRGSQAGNQGALLTQTLASAGVGAPGHPVLVCKECGLAGWLELVHWRLGLRGRIIFVYNLMESHVLQ
jgi:hypothetical protein